MRHAAAIGDEAPDGRILNDAGGIRMMFREGRSHVVGADRFLTEKTLAMYPRLDLEHQSWRELQAPACTRLRLHIARREFDAGRALAHAMIELTSERGLRRALMRSLVLALVLERSAGNRNAVMESRKVELAHRAKVPDNFRYQ